jgi:hypothetical protein
MEIPVRMRQTRMHPVGWESPPGFKCQTRSTSIEINGQKAATLSSYERYVADIAPGDTSVSVLPILFGSGRFTITFKTEAGKVYRLVVLPRGRFGWAVARHL